MQRAIRRAAILFVVVFAGIQVIRPSMTNPATPASASLVAAAPPAVSAILQRSCHDCHSNTTTWPWYSRLAPFSWMLASHVNDGRERFNFSEWTSLSSDDQDKFLGGICNMTQKGKMPLPSYLLIHRDATLSGADVATLCDWSKQARAALK